MIISVSITLGASKGEIPRGTTSRYKPNNRKVTK